jgi:hypothetical protein
MLLGLHLGIPQASRTPGKGLEALVRPDEGVRAGLWLRLLESALQHA